MSSAKQRITDCLAYTDEIATEAKGIKDALPSVIINTAANRLRNELCQLSSELRHERKAERQRQGGGGDGAL